MQYSTLIIAKMGRNIAYFLGIVITILLGTYWYVSFCCCTMDSADKKGLPNGVPMAKVSNATTFPFAINDGDFTYETHDNFNFNVASPSFLLPLSDSVKKGVTALKDHLSANPDKVIDLTGFYRSDEENTTAYPDLGVARANSVKNYLVINGIPSANINTMGQVMADLVPEDALYLGPIGYAISERAADADEELQQLYDRIKADPLVLYFETGAAAINLTAAQRQKVADISTYLDKVTTASCSVIGHTDNTGNRATNIALGQSRAASIKNYLMRNGILGAKITAVSEGPDDPIASNDTEEGRSKNRRVVVTLN